MSAIFMPEYSFARTFMFPNQQQAAYLNLTMNPLGLFVGESIALGYDPIFIERLSAIGQNFIPNYCGGFGLFQPTREVFTLLVDSLARRNLLPAYHSPLSWVHTLEEHYVANQMGAILHALSQTAPSASPGFFAGRSDMGAEPVRSIAKVLYEHPGNFSQLSTFQLNWLNNFLSRSGRNDDTLLLSLRFSLKPYHKEILEELKLDCALTDFPIADFSV